MALAPVISPAGPDVWIASATTLPITTTLPVTVPPTFAFSELLARMNADCACNIAAFAWINAAFAVLNAGCTCGATLFAEMKAAFAWLNADCAWNIPEFAWMKPDCAWSMPAFAWMKPDCAWSIPAFAWINPAFAWLYAVCACAIPAFAFMNAAFVRSYIPFVYGSMSMFLISTVVECRFAFSVSIWNDGWLISMLLFARISGV